MEIGADTLWLTAGEEWREVGHFPLKDNVCFPLHPQAPPAQAEPLGVPGPLDTELLSPV